MKKITRFTGIIVLVMLISAFVTPKGSYTESFAKKDLRWLIIYEFTMDYEDGDITWYSELFSYDYRGYTTMIDIDRLDFRRFVLKELNMENLSDQELNKKNVHVGACGQGVINANNPRASARALKKIKGVNAWRDLNFNRHRIYGFEPS